VDDEMRYTPFAKDYGPLNLAYTFDACIAIYGKLHVSFSLPITTRRQAERKGKTRKSNMLVYLS
jgi:cell division cycle 14